LIGLDFARIVVPNGSAGTHAGLAAGFLALGRDPSCVLSYTVLAPEEQARSATVARARDTLALIDPSLTLPDDAIAIDGAHRGPGYGIPTEGMREAVRLMARTEGLLLDPVYSGKAFAGLLHDVRAGAYPAGAAVLFVMTGGVPGLFAYRGEFAGA
jgi:L-cysteate sulfo-lyase